MKRFAILAGSMLVVGVLLAFARGGMDLPCWDFPEGHGCWGDAPPGNGWCSSKGHSASGIPAGEHGLDHYCGLFAAEIGATQDVTSPWGTTYTFTFDGEKWAIN